MDSMHSLAVCLSGEYVVLITSVMSTNVLHLFFTSRYTHTHSFTARSFISPHICDVCKKTVIIGVRCKHCKYKCHKACSKNAPHSCGLPDGLMDFFRKQVMLTSSPAPSMDMSPTETYPSRPILTGGNLDIDSPDSPGFMIHELSKEPSSSSKWVQGKGGEELLNLQ